VTRSILDSAHTRHHVLLGGWRDILDDIRRLNRGLQALSNGGACGYGATHLSGSCGCCRDVAGAASGQCGDCDALTHRLRAPMDELTADAFRFFPFVSDYLAHEDPDAARRASEIRRAVTALVDS
jgi:hypothetical protein